jgi:hypothetical protein
MVICPWDKRAELENGGLLRLREKAGEGRVTVTAVWNLLKESAAALNAEKTFEVVLKSLDLSGSIVEHK